MAKADTPMEFRHLTFKTGLNMTVRKGDKWLDSTGIYPAKTPDGIRNAKVRIVETLTTIFRDLQGDHPFLVLNHDPMGRTYSNLHGLMRDSYPGQPAFAESPAFHQDDMVTVVFFTVVDKGNSIEQEK